MYKILYYFYTIFEVILLENKSEFYKDIPIGLAMSLGINEFAMDFYAGLDSTTRDKVKKYVQNCNSGSEAKEKIRPAVKKLEEHDLGFLE